MKEHDEQDDSLLQEILEQMLGETEDLRADGLRKKPEPVKGVEISITVTPHGGKPEEEGKEDDKEDEKEDGMPSYSDVIEGMSKH